ncbi:hypothetical protein IJ096_00190 [Candidatus Saccharibacteria bacterium]|nr:hypothetical protein [Candidatus Saccharibacteria bacterium]
MENFTESILWNIPEQKSGTLTLIGGNSQNITPVIKTAEFLTKFPLKNLRIVLPDALKTNLPPLPNVVFTPSTPTGSFAKSPELSAALADSDATLLAGDFSKNSATCIALSEALSPNQPPTSPSPETKESAPTKQPIVWAKDTTDLLAPEAARLLEQGNITIIATIAQLQKLLRAMYYPKMLLLSMPIQPIKEVLHKFTLSYPVTILTLHESQIILVKSGEITTIPINKTPYTPLTLWTTDLPAKITALQLWNKSQPLAAAIAALNYTP